MIVNVVVKFDTNSVMKYYGSLPSEIPIPLDGVSFQAFGDKSSAYVFAASVSISRDRSISVGYEQVDQNTLVSGSFAYNF